MTAGRVAGWTVLVLALVGALGSAALYVPGWLAQRAEPAQPVAPTPRPPTRHIKATLYYVSEDGLRLVAVEREVPFGEGIVEQARQIVTAQLQAPPAPLLSAIPAGTSLRAVYVSERGEAFVDLSPEVSTGHPGGALDELLTVYSIVDVVTTNLPAISAVQILVDGRQVDTLAGHVDLRRPLPKSMLWLEASGQRPPAPSPAATTAAAPAGEAPPATPAGGEPPKR